MDKMKTQKSTHASPRKVCDEKIKKIKKIKKKTKSESNIFWSKVNSLKAVQEDWLNGFK